MSGSGESSAFEGRDEFGFDLAGDDEAEDLDMDDDEFDDDLDDDEDEDDDGLLKGRARRNLGACRQREAASRQAVTLRAGNRRASSSGG